jgi:hypothetical protein
MFGGALFGLGVLKVRLRDDSIAQSFIGWLQAMVLIVSVCFLFIVNRVWRKKAAEAVQEYRDRRAADLYRAITVAIPGVPLSKRLEASYCLYLRAFDTTQRVKIIVKAWTQRRGPSDPDLIGMVNIKGFGRTSVYRRYAVWGDLETLLADRLERLGAPLVALGRPGEQVGAGRVVSTGESWRRDVQQLADGARALLVLPATSVGTTWEIDYILGRPDLLRKSCFLIPPETSLLGEPGTMGGWFEPGAAPGPTIARRKDELDFELLSQVLGKDKVAEIMSLLNAPIGETSEAARRRYRPGYLREDAMNALREHGVDVSEVTSEGAVVTVGQDRASSNVRPLLRYRQTLPFIPGRFDPIRGELTEFGFILK